MRGDADTAAIGTVYLVEWPMRTHMSVVHGILRKVGDNAWKYMNLQTEELSVPNTSVYCNEEADEYFFDPILGDPVVSDISSVLREENVV